MGRFPDAAVAARFARPKDSKAAKVGRMGSLCVNDVGTPCGADNL